MTLVAVSVNGVVKASDLNQIINALSGLSNEPIHFDGVNNSSVYALTIRNQGSGSKGLIVQDAAGATILLAGGAGVLASWDGIAAAAPVVVTTGVQTLTNKTLSNPTLSGTISVAGSLGITGGNLLVGDGGNVASVAGVITLGTGNSFSITGTASITGITARTAGAVVWLRFASTAKLIKGGNLKIHSTFQGATDESIGLLSDGTNWLELSRSTVPKVQTGTYVGTGAGTPTITLDFTPSLVIISDTDNDEMLFLTEDTSFGSMRLREPVGNTQFPSTKIITNGFQTSNGSSGGNGSGTTYTYYAIGK